MITPDWCRMMAAYNAEMNRRLYVAAARLPNEARRREEGAFFGSLHATLSHLIWADMMWMARFDGGEKPSVGIRDSGRMVETWEEMLRLRASLDRRVADWTDTIEADWLAGEFHWFASSLQQDMRRPTAIVVTHFFNHQTHHRGQAHAVLTRLGEDTGATDLVAVLP
ncbi:DinB family protein [Roseomonas sp. CCTCC AB2023176]|uniref:DinB family protein n=1 Tax=Roseomonas sp. CCTCC AB2023176 TaxID=3342640 RepID=UPI0035DE84B5